jgi:hypothetical protein
MIDYKKLLQGRYEVEFLPEKNLSSDWIVPDFAYNVLNPLGLLYRPVVDEHFLKNGGKKPTWPDGKTFAVCLTHDVDYVSFFALRQWLRPRIEELRNRKFLSPKVRGLVGLGIDLMRSTWKSLERDPIHCLERWIEAEKKVNAHSTFFFWPGWSNVTQHHHSDCSYELFDRIVFANQKCTVSEMIQEINRCGWEIGLHPSFYSLYNVVELKRQKEALENVIEKEILSVRQHYLFYDIRISPHIHAQAGFQYDSTLGFNDNVGFRFGTSYPWYLFDLKVEKELPILELPLIVQDGALLKPDKGMRLDEETAFEYVVQLTETIENVGGVLTLLWHPHSICNKQWWNLYLRTLEYLYNKDSWFGTIQDIGHWWKKNRMFGAQHNKSEFSARLGHPYISLP